VSDRAERRPGALAEALGEDVAQAAQDRRPTTDATPEIEWYTPGEEYHTGTFLSITRTSVYLSSALYRSLGQPSHVRLGRLPDGRIILRAAEDGARISTSGALRCIRGAGLRAWIGGHPRRIRMEWQSQGQAWVEVRG